jgi:hypothetical protein
LINPSKWWHFFSKTKFCHPLNEMGSLYFEYLKN